MKKTILMLPLAMQLLSAAALAGPDQFLGDSAIYSALAGNLRPNILLLIDNSNVTLNSASGTKYDPAIDYCQTYRGSACTYHRYSVYQAGQQGDFSTSPVITNTDAALGNIACTDNGGVVTRTLSSNGTYVSSATISYPSLKKGTGPSGGEVAVCDTSGKGTTYALGNFLNYTLSSAGATGESQRKVIYNAIRTVIGGARYAANFGAMVYGNNKGGKVIYQVGDLSSDSAFNAFLSVIPGIDENGYQSGEEVLSSQTARPQAEALLDAGYYFRGETLPVSGQAAMPSPSSHSCDKNHVIVITNGLSNKDDSPQLATLVGDQDQDGMEAVSYGLGTHYLDDVAKYLYDYEAPRVSTDTILAFQSDDPLIRRAADANHGHGHFFNVANANELAAALVEIITNVMLESNASFLAPVVPVSPENRSFSGTRVYMGLFKPRSQTYWHGNLKKYGLNGQYALTDRNSALANYTDSDGDGRDDLDGSTLPSGAVTGSFRNSASSFWSGSADGGTLEAGGAGEVLAGRDFAATPRKIYTYTGTSSNLTDASNAFTTTNGAITAATLGVADGAAKDSLISFVHGLDAFDENSNGNTTEKRGGSDSGSPWIFGDILHSRPLVVPYTSYSFNAANERDCSLNKSMIYLGANDGMLHAIRDCNGSEAWGFIPPDLLGNLKYLPHSVHTYFVDATPSIYTYSSSNDGVVRTGSGDKVILIFGERRGGGVDSAPTSGSYYALDVSDPATPRFLWRISSQTTGFEELAESWSEPKLVRMRIDSTTKIVAFVGAGYDNIHEDTRYGNNQFFTNAASVASWDVGNGNITSGGSTSPTGVSGARGRGIYAIEVATLNSAGVPSFANSGSKIWGYVYGETAQDSVTPPASSTNPLLKYSIPGEIAALDKDNDGYADTLYVGDTGGRIWKFNVRDDSVSNWQGTRLFTLNTGSVVGKKFFYKPSVVVEQGYTMLFIGSGDREHPLNRDTSLVDRMYALKDRGQTTADDLTEADLTNVTADLIQSTTETSGASSISGITLELSASYGWYLGLNQRAGEKILSSPTVFGKVAYFTTFTPNSTIAADPCAPGNPGISRLYAVNYKNGAAVLNFDTSNDALVTTNTLATSLPGKVLLRSDRYVVLGPGMSSGIVVVITPGGDAQGLVGVGGTVTGIRPRRGGSIIPLYWRQK